MKKTILTTSILAVLACSNFAAEYTQSKYSDYMNTADSTFTSSTGKIIFQGGWDSLNDTVNLSGELRLEIRDKEYNITKGDVNVGELYLNYSKYNIKNSTITTSKGLAVKNIADAVIENSKLNITGYINMQQGGGPKLYIKNSTTVFNASGSSMSQVVNGASLTVEGGSFTVNGSKSISLDQGSSITFKDTTVDLGNSSIATKTAIKSEDSAKIIIDKTTFSGSIDLYGVDEYGSLPSLEIKNASVVTTGISMRGGTILVSGGSELNITSNLSKTSVQGGYEEPVSDIIIAGDSKVSVAGDVKLDSVNLTDGTLLANSISTKSLIVGENSAITLAEDGTLGFDNLEVIVDDALVEGQEFDLNSVLSGDLGIVLSSIEVDEQIVIGNGTNKFSATVTEDGFALIGTKIPEPSTYAMILGAITFGFVAYRRRK